MIRGRFNITPLHTLLITILGIFLAEVVAMIVLLLLPPMPYAYQVMIDGAIMTALIFPLLYVLMFRRLLRHVVEREKATETAVKMNRQLQASTQAEQVQRGRAEALLEATSALNSSLDLNDVLEDILVQVRRVIDFRAAAILLAQGERVVVAHQFGADESLEALSDIQDAGLFLEAFPFLQEVVASQHPRRVTFAHGRRPSVDLSAVGLAWLRSYLVAPLLARGESQGLVLLLDDELDSFREEDLQLLTGFTGHAGMAVYNARLFTQEQRARETAEVLRAASVALAQSLDLDHICQQSLDSIARLAPYDRAALVLRESEDLLTVSASRPVQANGGAEQLSPIPIRVEDFPYLQVLLAEQRSTRIPDTGIHPDWLSLSRHDGARSWLGVPMVAGGRTIGFYSLEKNEAGYFVDEHVRLVEALAGQAAVAIQNAWLFEQVRRGSERLHALSRRLVEIQESERHYIARELHDEAGQALTTLVVALKMLEEQADRPQRVRALADEMERTVQQLIEDLHRLAKALRPAALDHLGLEAALRQHVAAISEVHGLAVQLALSGISERLPSSMETTLYRLVQEALTNIVRHARATRVDVLLKRRGDRFVVVVEDDGIGFEPLDGEAGQERLGMLGMRERAEMLGGELIVESAPGRGTTVVVEVPYVDPHSGS